MQSELSKLKSNIIRHVPQQEVIEKRYSKRYRNPNILDQFFGFLESIKCQDARLFCIVIKRVKGADFIHAPEAVQCVKILCVVCSQSSGFKVASAQVRIGICSSI